MKSEIKRALFWDIGIPGPPLEIEIHPTEKSNLEINPCKCLKETLVNPKTLGQSQLEKIVHQGCELGVKKWIFKGDGEPLLIKDRLISLMQYIKDHMAHGTLQTNGTMFTPSNVTDIVTMAWDRIEICMPSSAEDNYFQIVQTEKAYEHIINGIDMITDIKDELGTDKPVIDIFLPITPKTYDNIGDMLKWAKTKDINRVRAEPPSALSSAELELIKLDTNELNLLKNHIPSYHSLARSLNIKFDIIPINEEFTPKLGKKRKKDERNKSKDSDLSFPSNELDSETLFCLEPYLKMVFRPRLGIGPCPISRYEQDNKNYLSANELAENDLDDLWKAPLFTYLRENAKTGFVDFYCNNCPKRLRTRQMKSIKSLKLSRDRFLRNTIDVMIRNKSENDPRIKERLDRIRKLTKDINLRQGELVEMRRYHLELEKIRSRFPYRVLRKLRVIKE